MDKRSVIVPIYKTEQFLKKCIESIVNQTYKNMEIILIDDGSPDNCGNICDEYAKRDERIKVIHRENKGLSSARNTGIEVATGEFVAFVDSDDWIDLDMYESLIELADKYNADIVEGGYRYIRPWKAENKILDGPNTGDIMVFDNKTALEQLYFGPQLFSDVSIMTVDKIYKKSVLDDIRFADGRYEDVEFTPRVLYKADKIVKLDRAFYNYNIHLGTASMSGSGMTYNKLVWRISQTRSVADFFEEHKLDKISEYTKSAYYSSLMDVCYECYLRRNEKQFKWLFDSVKTTIFQSKNEIKNNQYLNKKKTMLFFYSPYIYFWTVWIVRTHKSTRYNLRRKFTGKK